MTSLHRTRPLLAAVGFFAILAAGSTAQAQDDTVYIGGNGSASGSAARNSVQVDMSVLDDIGGRPPISKSLLPLPGGSLNGQRVTLSPPGSATAKKPQAPRHATPAKSPAPQKAPAPASKPTASASPPPPSAPAPMPALTEPPPPPAQIDLATAMPPPPEAKAAPSAVRPPEPVRATAPRELKAVPSPTPVLSTVAAPEPSAPTPSPARLPEPAAARPVITPAVATPAAVTPVAVMSDAPVASAPAPVASAPAPAPAQVAALPPARQAGAGPQSLRIPFSGEAAVLPEPAKGELKQVAGALSKDSAMRVQVMAYASGSDDGGKARRLSLSRALAVRTYLIEQGIGSTRIDVRALGNTAEGGPGDRVDLVVVSR
jgi:outer membrane protein OmpA-like peptidoglycan-associated protein